MRRRLFSYLCLLSLLLWLGAGVLWVRGFWVGDSVSMEQSTPDGNFARKREVSFASDWGGVAVTYRNIRDWKPFSLFEDSATDGPKYDCHYHVSPTWNISLWPGGRDGPLWNRLGFNCSYETNEFGNTQAIPTSSPIVDARGYLSAPWWFVLGILAVLPVVGGRRMLRHRCPRRRKQQGLCSVCGYDLRASAHRCPECGTAVPQTPADTTNATGIAPSKLAKGECDVT